MSKVRIILPLACLVLGACTGVDRGFGETVTWNNVRQTINPEGVEPTPGAPIEGGSGAKADTAVDRYERGAVTQPSVPSTGGVGGGGSSGGSGGGLGGSTR